MSRSIARPVFAAAALSSLMLLSACSTRQVYDKYSGSTAQRLVTYSIQKLASEMKDDDFEGMRGKNIHLNTHFIVDTQDLRYAHEYFEMEFRKRFDMKMVAEKDADYVFDLFFYSLGTDQDTYGLTVPIVKGTLNIGVGPIIEQIYFPKVLLDFTEETSNVRITLTTDSGERLLQLIQEGSIDVGIGPFRKSDIPEDLISRSVQSANIILVCRSGHPVLDDIKGNGVVSLLDLSKYPNIGPSTPDSYKEHLPEEFKKFRPLITCENYMSSKSIVSCSDYITGGPEILFEKEIRNGSLVKIPTNFTMQWSSFCIVRPESINIPSVKKFLDIFSSYLTSDL